MFGNLGVQEILLIGVFCLIFFGAKKIPDLMKGMGKGVREFKDAMSNVQKEVEGVTSMPDKVESKPVVTEASGTSAGV